MSDNGGCVVFFVFSGFLALGIFLYLGFKADNRSRGEKLSLMARRWNGHVVPDGMLDEPRLVLLVDKIPGEVTFALNDPIWTKVQFNWPAPRRLRMAPEGFEISLRRLLGANEIQVGDAGFDAAFWIETSDAPWAREVLSRRVRRGILDFHWPSSWRTTGGVYLDIGPAGLTLQFRGSLLDDRPRLESFIELAVLILELARGSTAVAGVVVADVEHRGGSSCPVCGQAVEGGLRCPSCRTPHHDDCWKYSGGCAIFACGSRRPAA